MTTASKTKTYAVTVTETFEVARTITYVTPAPDIEDLEEDQSPIDWLEDNWRDNAEEVDREDEWDLLETSDPEFELNS